MAHTPDPWVIGKTTYGNYMLLGANGEDILCGQSGEGFISHFEDASLIAAAPDLFRALKKLVKAKPDQQDLAYALIMAENAIYKAEDCTEGGIDGVCEESKNGD